MSKSWEYHDHYVFSGVDLNTNPKVFNNLLGDTWDYRVYLYMNADSAANVLMNLYCNGDTSANYRRYEMQGYASSTAAAAVSSNANTYVASTGSGLGDYPCFIVWDVLGSSGGERYLGGPQAREYSTEK